MYSRKFSLTSVENVEPFLLSEQQNRFVLGGVASWSPDQEEEEENAKNMGSSVGVRETKGSPMNGN